MQEKIYEFKISQPLTPARRKAIISLIKEHAPRSPWEIDYAWDETETRLMVTSKPMSLEVVFHPGRIEVFREASLWARMLITKKKQDQMQEVLVNVLKELGFFDAKKPAKAPASRAGKIKK